METLEAKIQRYQAIILSFLTEEAQAWKNENPSEWVIADKEKYHYQLLHSGWVDKDKYVHYILVHFHIETDGKIWLLENNTERLLAEELVGLGVPKSDIVLGFQPIRYRQYTDYAVM